MTFPERAISEPEALHVLFDSELPSDVTFQLKACQVPIQVT